MKVNKYILLAFAVLALASCYEDKSTGATLPLSDIFISEEGLQKVYNINKNDTLVIEPIITQAHEELELSYTRQRWTPRSVSSPKRPVLLPQFPQRTLPSALTTVRQSPII